MTTRPRADVRRAVALAALALTAVLDRLGRPRPGRPVRVPRRLGRRPRHGQGVRRRGRPQGDGRDRPDRARDQGLGPDRDGRLGRRRAGQDRRRGERQAVGAGRDLRPDRQEGPQVRGRADPGRREGREPRRRRGLPRRLPHPVQAREVRRRAAERRPGDGPDARRRRQDGKLAARPRPARAASDRSSRLAQGTRGRPRGLVVREPGPADPRRRPR